MPHGTRLDVAPLRYLSPRQVLAGHGTRCRIGHELQSSGTGPGTVLIIADRIVSRSGRLSPLLEGLTSAGFVTDVFDDIAGEPDEMTAERATERARAARAVAVVGAGGGSAMDVAKLTALLVTNDGQVSDWLGVVSPPVPVAPLVLVPTTTGTGSEATRISMINVAGSKRVISCAQFLPQLAVLDTDLVADLPTPVVASTGIDALSHAVESMLSTNRTWFSLAMSTQAIEILRSDLDIAALQNDADAKGRVLYAAHLAGLALNAGVVLGHSLAYVIARHVPMPHGTSCSMALPYCLAYNRSVAPELAAYVARTVTGDRSENLEAAADYVAELAERLTQPASLAAVGIAQEELPKMAQEIISEYPRPNNPVPFEPESLRTLLAHMHSGDLAGLWSAKRG
jgi:alcohol dehydrogenase class IV